MLLVAVPCYIIMIYGQFFLPTDLFELFNSIAMAPAILAELLLAIILIIKSKKIPKSDSN
jgi:hypothetical protein